ncbi:CAP domain-containing protein [Bacillus songklensis]|uniref:CAP domain-containing protein n=1 Tax=Bacillus songklensis TaxID=1069116 RepID=A0ABV8B5T2_9BACI
MIKRPLLKSAFALLLSASVISGCNNGDLNLGQEGRNDHNDNARNVSVRDVDRNRNHVLNVRNVQNGRNDQNGLRAQNGQTDQNNRVFQFINIPTPDQNDVFTTCDPSVDHARNGHITQRPITYREIPGYNQSRQNPSPTGDTAAPGQTGNQAAPSTSADNMIQQVVQLTNEQRRKNGLPDLQVDGKLAGVAQTKATDMMKNKYFSHTSPTYGSPFDMMNQFGVSYTAAGENIAQGQPSAQQVVNDWMNSPGHRANILNRNFTHIGVGHTTGQHYWVQQFIKK